MVTVETTHADLRLALLGLVELLLDAGAWVHPQLRIVERERQISVWTDGDDPWLMRIPRDSLVPVANVAWSEKPPLQSTAVPNSFTPLQRAVLEACTAVMVAAGTWEHFHATHPRATITDPNAIEMIRSLHPPFTAATDADAMLRTRTIRMSLDGSEPTSYLMPLLDLVNHHPGAPGYVNNDEGLGIGTWRSTVDGECSVSYGSTRDALGIALAYGYVDERITRVNALPGQYALPGGDTLRVVRASQPDWVSEPNMLTVVGAAFDAHDPDLERRSVVEPLERHLRKRGVPALRARHEARLMARRILKSDSGRLLKALDVLDKTAGCELVSEAVYHQHRLVAGQVVGGVGEA